MKAATVNSTEPKPPGQFPPDLAIRANNLTKRYGPVQAVRGIDLKVLSGEIFGMIGPDGAGKTSTLQILAGVLQPDDGAAYIYGELAREAREQTGYLTQTFSLYPDLTVMENIRYIGRLRRLPSEQIEERGRRYLQVFNIDRFRDRLAGYLSGGMKQKLALACALVSRPRVLLLDEPTTGVDPVSRREFWDTLADLAASGLAIIVATPYLDEAERCHHIALMYNGTIPQSGKPAELRASLCARRLELRADNLPEVERVVSESNGNEAEVLDVQRFGDRLDVLVRRPEMAAQVVAKLRSADVTFREVREDDPTLENVFVASLRSFGETTQEPEFPARRVRGNHSEVAIDARDLTRRFGNFTAVNKVSLQIRAGEIYGLLGANGAGKTTTIKMLCGLLDRTGGEIAMLGERDLRSAEMRQRIGYMSQRFSLYDDLSVRENLDFFAGVYGVSQPEREEKMRWVLSFSGLEGKEKQITGSLPGGWKKRVAFGAAIMHEPDVLFLDEPTSGVDPLARRAFWSMIHKLADAGTAILVTTHYLEESEQCNRLGLMVGGELSLEDTPSAIKARQPGHLLEFVVDQPQRAADLLRRATQDWSVSVFGDRLHVITHDEVSPASRSIVQVLESNDIRVHRVSEEQFSMEDVFISVVETAQRNSGRHREK